MSENDRGARRGGRAKYLRLGEGLGVEVAGGAPSNDTAPAVTLTRGELRELVRQAAAEACAEQKPAAPALLDREGLCHALRCSPSLVDKLRRRGMPSVRLGDSPRFELEPVLEWLRHDSKGGAA